MNTSVIGTYQLIYNVVDSNGLPAIPVSRLIEVGIPQGTDNMPPTITLAGSSTVVLVQGSPFTDPGATASDPQDGNITAKIKVSGTVDTSTVGNYILTYNVTDNEGLSAIPVIRVIDVTSPTTPQNQRPFISLLGGASIEINQGSVFHDPGATAFDPQDGDITSKIVVTGTVNTSVIGSYIIKYDVTDSLGLTAITQVRVVTVVSGGAPANPGNPGNPNNPTAPNNPTNPFSPLKIIDTFPNIVPAAKSITNFIQSPVGSVLTHAVSTTGLLLGAVATLLATAFSNSFALGDLLLLPGRLLSLFFTFFGLRKRRLPWGTVYDSVTKQPLDPAYVVLRDMSGKEVATSITDLDGRFGFFVPRGVYYISVQKPNYVFPSKKLTGRTRDEIYADLYFGERIEIPQDGMVIYKNIPMDQLKFDWNEFAKRRMGVMKFHSRWEKGVAIFTNWLFRIGFIVAIIALFAAPEPYNFIIFGLYVLVAITRLIIRPKTRGTITESATGAPLSFAIIEIFSEALNQVLFTKVADQYGHYYVLVPKGDYVVKVSKKNDDQSYTEVYKKRYSAEKGIINSNIKV